MAFRVLSLLQYAKVKLKLCFSWWENRHCAAVNLFEIIQAQVFKVNLYIYCMVYLPLNA